MPAPGLTAEVSGAAGLADWRVAPQASSTNTMLESLHVLCFIIFCMLFTSTSGGRHDNLQSMFQVAFFYLYTLMVANLQFTLSVAGLQYALVAYL